MRVASLPLLLGCLIVGGTTAPAANPPGHPGSHPGGVLPVPGMGPPGAVAAVGALPIPNQFHAPGAPAIPAPLVAAKFLAPQGVRVTALPGSSLARLYDTPTVMGLRPGYVYRFELTNLPYNPGKALYPEVEVRGTLVPRPGMKYMDYPIPLMFTPMDIERALGGALITKVIYLEDPEKAIPVEVNPDSPVETPEDTETAALKAARDNGRLMAIVRLGDRKPSAAELYTVAVDGTILLPGEKQLKGPVLPPVFPFWAVPMYDPILGPRGPKEECFVNGDDKADPLGFGRDGRLGGLNPTDVGVEYTVSGKRKVTTSCMACICAPRYMVRRVELQTSGFEHRQYLGQYQERSSLAALRERAAPMADIGREKANELIGRLRPSAYISRVGTSFFIGTQRPIAIAQVEGVKVTGALVEPEQLTAYPTLCPLTVTKVIDPPGPKQSGDVVTVTIRYANTGARPASDLVVSDSLSGRLEYIPGSAQTDRPSNFTVAENEVGSVLLRWELPGTLMPGQGGTIKF
jgi:uncharacterized repeat protein (TIGR01451 family)